MINQHNIGLVLFLVPFIHHAKKKNMSNIDLDIILGIVIQSQIKFESLVQVATPIYRDMLF